MDSRHYHHEKLASARRDRGDSQQTIAEKIGVDRQTIYRAEAGANASYDLLVSLAGLYGIPMSELVIDFPETAAAG